MCLHHTKAFRCGVTTPQGSTGKGVHILGGAINKVQYKVINSNQEDSGNTHVSNKTHDSSGLSDNSQRTATLGENPLWDTLSSHMYRAWGKYQVHMQ